MVITLRLQPLFLLFALFSANLARAQSSTDTTITLKAIAGLQYDMTRLVLRPNTRLRLILENYDDMAHNLVITQPNSRVRVVDASLRLGADGAKRDYIPDMPEVLAHTREVEPGRADTLSFTVPEGTFPYVCTYPGHGYIMYGVIYGTRQPNRLPSPDADPNVPKRGSTAQHAHHQVSGHPYDLTLPAVYRTFMPDCGPAAIAVGLPAVAGGPEQSYCFDAGLCQLRYAWAGGFVDNTDQWDGKGNKLTKLVGDIYYRAEPRSAAAGTLLTASTSTLPNSKPMPAPANLTFPLRIGSASGGKPVVKFKGYRLVNRYPEFSYLVDGVLVRELIKPLPGGRGLVRQFSVAPTSQAVTFFADEQAGIVYKATRMGKPIPLRNGRLVIPSGSATSAKNASRRALPRQFTIWMSVL